MARKRCEAHHWVLAEPEGASIAGRCKKCGAKREFPSNPEMDFHKIPHALNHPAMGYSVRLAREGF